MQSQNLNYEEDKIFAICIIYKCLISLLYEDCLSTNYKVNNIMQTRDHIKRNTKMLNSTLHKINAKEYFFHL